MTTKQKPAAPAKKRGEQKPAAPTATPKKPTAKPQPLSELEQRARKMALEGMRALDQVAYMAELGAFPLCDESDSAENKALLDAGEWGKALRLVSEALWNLDGNGGGLIDAAGYLEASKAVEDLKVVEAEAQRVESRNKLLEYCAKRQAEKDAEWKKAVAEGRVLELVKYDPKTGKGTWRTVTA